MGGFFVAFESLSPSLGFAILLQLGIKPQLIVN
jgi:hypothetical protein